MLAELVIQILGEMIDTVWEETVPFATAYLKQTQGQDHTGATDTERAAVGDVALWCCSSGVCAFEGADYSGLPGPLVGAPKNAGLAAAAPQYGGAVLSSQALRR